MAKNMGTWEIATVKTIAASDTYTTEGYSIKHGAYFSVIVDAVSGTGPDYDISYQVADHADGTYITPATNSIILDDQNTTAVATFTPVPAQYIRFIILNNNAVNALIITAKFTMQEEI